MVAYDAHVVDRPGEEDTLARLVAHSRPLRTPRSVVGLFCSHIVSFSFLSLFFLFLFLLSSTLHSLDVCFFKILMEDIPNYFSVFREKKWGKRNSPAPLLFFFHQMLLVSCHVNAVYSLALSIVVASINLFINRSGKCRICRNYMSSSMW